MSLVSNAVSMGLTEHAERPDMFSYSDKYGDVIYRQLRTFKTPINSYTLVDSHSTDNQELDHYAVFAKHPTSEYFSFCGIVSRIYRFEGHDKLNTLIRQSIESTGNPIVHERSWFPESVVMMRSEFIMQSSVSTPEAGDIYPTIFSFNSYNGTGAQGVSYGISISEDGDFKSFSFDLGSIKSIHTYGAKTRIQSTTSSYLQVFTENISEVIRRNFNTPLTEDFTFKTLDFIEKVGKKKRLEVSKFLEEIMKTNESGVRRVATAWEMFLAIMKCSNLSGNINVKRLLESAAERVLVLPDRMAEALKTL
jgi:hypothetical protein